MKKINKKYDELIRQADNAFGRKEVVSLLKKAAKIRSLSEENLASWLYKINFYKVVKSSIRKVESRSMNFEFYDYKLIIKNGLLKDLLRK